MERRTASRPRRVPSLEVGRQALAEKRAPVQADMVRPAIRLLSEWFYFDRPGPRLGRSRLLRFVPLLNQGNRIVHYRLAMT